MIHCLLEGKDLFTGILIQGTLELEEFRVIPHFLFMFIDCSNNPCSVDLPIVLFTQESPSNKIRGVHNCNVVILFSLRLPITWLPINSTDWVVNSQFDEWVGVLQILPTEQVSMQVRCSLIKS